MLAPVSEANERAVYQSMLEGCQAALEGCASSSGSINAGLCQYSGIHLLTTQPCGIFHACREDQISIL